MDPTGEYDTVSYRGYKWVDLVWCSTREGDLHVYIFFPSFLQFRSLEAFQEGLLRGGVFDG